MMAIIKVESRSPVVTVLNRINFRGYIIDNQSLKTIPGKIEINGQTFVTDSTGHFLIPVKPVALLDSLKAYGIDMDADTINTFVQTYRNIPMSENWITPAGLMVTTFDSLVYGHNVPDSLAVTPELFREFAEEGNFRGGWPYADPKGLKSIDFQHAQNPVPNPSGPHGYVYWIDRDFLFRRIPSDYDSLSLEQQLFIKDVIEREVIAKIRDTAHKPQTYLAKPGEDPPLLPGTPYIKVDYGILFVSHMRGGNGYNFGWNDYDKDGKIDAASIFIGDPPNSYGRTAQESASIIIPNNILNPAMTGKSIQAIYGGGFLKPADLKMGAMEENTYFLEDRTITPIFIYTLADSTDVTRFYYSRLAPINDILWIMK